MARAKDRFIQAALDLAWSHWTGLGVRGTATAPDTAVDPEALIYLTASLATHDPRLRDEATDWWARFQRHVSRPRLGRLVHTLDPRVVSKFVSLEQQAQKAGTSGKSQLDRLDHPARALLRLRCIFGANARAEVVLALLTQWATNHDGVTASALAEVGYSKRNVVLVLDDLRLAGLIATSADANRIRYRLANPDALRAALGPLPLTSGRWHLRLPIIANFVELAEQLRTKDVMIQAVEARKLVAKHADHIAAIGIAEPRISSAESYWEELQDWLVDHMMSSPEDPARRLPRMIEGVWIGPSRQLSKPQRFSSAILPALAANPKLDSEMFCLDLVQVATITPPNDWAWMVLSEAGIYTYEHTIGLSQGEPWHFATWELGQLRHYRAQLLPPLRHARIAAAFGDLAAERARKDRSAVQLRLTRVPPATVDAHDVV